MSAFGQAKPFASLSSTLLARKGQAKPAMRSQGYGGFGAMPNAQDDLGWNDMGHVEEAVPRVRADRASAAPPVPVPVSVPPVLVERAALREEIAAPVAAPVLAERRVPAPKPVSVATATRISRETHQKHGPKGQGRTAFTLRLDQDRHLRLRLASALQNVSAQVLVTEALDLFLQTLPDVDALVRQLPASPKR